MRYVIDIAIAVAVAMAVGLASAWFAVEYGRNWGTVAVGPWSAWPEAGSPDANPYAAAIIARSGEVPLGAAEGLAFTATADSSGEPLSGRCRYVVSGPLPAARLWTLTVQDIDGHLMSNAAFRNALHSRELLRQPDGTFQIVLSAQVEPGNWLPVDAGHALELVLRLYDTPLTSTLRPAELVMPDIVRGACA